MVSLIYAWINDWANDGEAGDLRRHRAYDDVTVITFPNGLHMCDSEIGYLHKYDFRMKKFRVLERVAFGLHALILCNENPCSVRKTNSAMHYYFKSKVVKLMDICVKKYVISKLTTPWGILGPACLRNEELKLSWVHVLIFTPVWVSDHIPSKVCDKNYLSIPVLQWLH